MSRWNRPGGPEVKIHIFESEVDSIIEEVKSRSSLETGGDLFGTFTHGNMPVIWLASGPGPKAKHEVAEFVQDTEFTNHWQIQLMREFGIQFIGTWHSHHRLGLTQPSGGDVRSAQLYARSHHRNTTIEIIATLGSGTLEVELSPYYYYDAERGKLNLASFDIKPGLSPIRDRLGSAWSNISQHTDFNNSPHQQYHVLNRSGELGSLDKPQPHSSPSNYPESSLYEDLQDKLPADLLLQIDELNKQDFRVELDHRGGNLYMLMVPINHLLLAIAIEAAGESSSVLQINLIDQTRRVNQNITDDIKRSGFLNQQNWGVKIAEYVVQRI